MHIVRTYNYGLNRPVYYTVIEGEEPVTFYDYLKAKGYLDKKIQEQQNEQEN